MVIKMKKIGLYAWFGGNVSIRERFQAIQEVGFDSVALYWGNDYPEITGNNEATLQMIQNEFHLEVENLHAPYQHADDLFSDDEKKAKYVMQLYFSCLEAASRYHVPVIVIHLTGDFCNPNQINPKGIERLQSLVHFAQAKHVKMAFENLTKNGLPYLDAVLKQYPDECVGFCYDLGHDHLYSEKEFEILKKYQHRLYALHLHGNDGKKDEHKRIVEGNIDLEKFKMILKNISFQCPVSLEVIQNLSFRSYHEFKQYVNLLKEDCLYLLK